MKKIKYKHQQIEMDLLLMEGIQGEKEIIAFCRIDPIR